MKHIRISFLPKRPERSLDTERPMLIARKKRLEKLLVIGDGRMTLERSDERKFPLLIFELRLWRFVCDSACYKL
jgi:hypothetical protein